MKLVSKVRFESQKNAQYLVRAFFQNFHPDSSFLLKGNHAEMEIFFDEPPMEIVEAICQCDEIEIEYFNDLTMNGNKQKINHLTAESEDLEKNEQNEENTGETENSELHGVVKNEETVSEIMKDTPEVFAGQENSTSKEQTDNSRSSSLVNNGKKEENRAPKAKKRRSYNRSKNATNIPELFEFAKKSNSYESFVEFVIKWIQPSEKEELFKKIVMISSDLVKISWGNIEAELKRQKIQFKPYDKILCTKYVAKKFENSENSITILSFIKAVISYKNFEFGSHDVESMTTIEEERLPDNEVTENPTNISKTRVKMECMPEIPEFEEMLGSIDKTDPIEERVVSVLSAMGWKNDGDNTVNGFIFKLVNRSLRFKNVKDVGNAAEKCSMSIEQYTMTRLSLLNLLKEFIGKYYPDKKAVNAFQFMQELQSIIMLESEIED